jgi:hypothetical protein
MAILIGSFSLAMIAPDMQGTGKSFVEIIMVACVVLTLPSHSYY